MAWSRQLLLIALLMGLAVIPSRTHAQEHAVLGEPGPTVTLSEASFHDLLQRLDALEASVQAKGAESKDGGWPKADTSQAAWTVRWGGRAMADVVLFPSQNLTSIAAMGSKEQNYFQVRRLRLDAQGEGYDCIIWRCELEFAPLIPQEYVDSTTGFLNNVPPFVTIRDVYMGVRDVPLLGQVQFGNFKTPFSLDELTSDSATTFLERSLISTAFVPLRQLGICAFDHSADENVTWACGWFFDDTPQAEKMRASDELGSQVIGRVTWTPYYDEPGNGQHFVHTALAWRYVDDFDNRIRFRTRPEGNAGNRSLDTGAFNGDWYECLGAELAAVHGPLSLQTEFVWTHAHASGGQYLSDGKSPNRIPNAGYYDFFGGYVYVSYFLTGESRPYNRTRGDFGRLVPLENFRAVRGAGLGPGAWEIAVRWSYEDLGGTESLASGVENDLTLAVNWYWNRNMRWMFEYIHAWSKYDNPAKLAGGDLGQIDILGMRGQFDW
jgi:phosphate-selective porin OprO and OprP